ncbi:DUF2971 domain-containing protein [Vibrio fluvialis]|uniref:DUF2971 domain-containing protein n=1 Tax=Vibrio fluvialis TaxID=676 RepID=UPI001EEA9EF4|nr:DUF2971 domain-containing protein [Vibrio fluvialis]MCG6363885.1 DUF2971 domain-containing protein [Vibrio fluvialis]
MKLYHYTDAASLIGIIEHKKVWMNDVNFMNDSNELFDAVRILGQVGNELGETIYIQLAKTIMSLRNHPPQMMHFFFRGFFITSFCKEDDLLDMWRGYGSNGQKYSIEFDSDILVQQIQNEIPDGSFSIEACIYEQTDKVTAMKSFIEQNPHEDTTKQEGHEQSLQLETAWLQKFYRLALTFKNSGFKSEKEIRLIGHIMDSKYIKHRVNNFGITPYIEVPLSKPCISSFRIGPTQDRSLAMYSLNSLINKSTTSGNMILISTGSDKNDIRMPLNFSDTSFRQK